MTVKEMISSVASQIEAKAVDAHLEGIALLRRAAKLEQLSEIMTERQAVTCLDNLIAGGLVRIVAGKAMICDKRDSAADTTTPSPDVVCTSTGGKA